MSKRERTESADALTRVLRDWGIADTATATDLLSFLGRSAEGDRAIAHRLGAIVEPESVVALQRIEREATDKDVRKEAKRALYRLEQRGLEIPTPAAAPVAPVLAVEIEGWISPVDGRGDQLVWLLKARTDGVAHLFAVINDPDGLREVELNVVTRKSLKHAREELAQKHDLHLIAADWRYCDFLVHRAFTWARTRGTPMHGDYPALRTQIARDPAPEHMEPLILSRVDADSVRADHGTMTQSADILQEKELRTWFLNADEARPYLEEVSGAQESPLVLSPVQQDDRIRRVLDRALDERFSGDAGASYARRLFEMAYFFFATRREPRARQALAVALALSDGTRAAEIPLCEQLIRASLAMWHQIAAEQQAEQGKASLIMTPQQFAAQRTKHQR